MFNVTEYEAESREAGERKEKEGRGARVRAYHFFYTFYILRFGQQTGGGALTRSGKPRKSLTSRRHRAKKLVPFNLHWPRC